MLHMVLNTFHELLYSVHIQCVQDLVVAEYFTLCPHNPPLLRRSLEIEVFFGGAFQDLGPF